MTEITIERIDQPRTKQFRLPIEGDLWQGRLELSLRVVEGTFVRRKSGWTLLFDLYGNVPLSGAIYFSDVSSRRRNIYFYGSPIKKANIEIDVDEGVYYETKS